MAPSGPEGHAPGPQRIRELDLDLILPEAGDERDRCVDDLVDRLSRHRGIADAHVESRDGAATLCLHYDPDVASLSEVERVAADAGAAVTDRYGHERFWVRGMDCGDCAASIAHVLSRRDGVLGARGNYAAERVWVEWDAAETTRGSVVDAIEAMGYEVEDEPGAPEAGLLEEFGQAALAGLLLAAGLVGEAFLGLPASWAAGLHVAAGVVAGYEVAWHGLQAARGGRLDIDVLMVVAGAGAAALGRFAEAAFLLFLFNLGHALEHRATDRARAAVRDLRDLAPPTARVRRDGDEREVPVEAVERGDVVSVRPGERVPVDGEVVSGGGPVDESPITGESVPADKRPGDEVYAGSLNRQGALVVEATALARDSTLARVVEMVEEAQARRAPAERFSQTFEERFVPAVLLLVVAVAAVPPLLPVLAPGSWAAGALGLPWREAVLRGLAVLVAASPCALAISVPSSVLSAVAGSARRGVLVKGGAHLEALASADAVALDKTGTLTRGEPEVVAVHGAEGRSGEEVLRWAAGAEAGSDHPLARAVVAEARSRGLDVEAPQEAESLAGRGVRARVDGHRVLVGNTALFEAAGADPLPPDLAEVRDTEEGRGRTVCAVAREGTYLGLLSLADRPRGEARGVVSWLRGRGLHVAMLTGDRRPPAEAVAAEVGIDDVRAELLPEGKVEAVEALADEHGTVVMVGDGVNDAPALTRADVGVAMGARGSDVALETADVALMGDDLDGLREALSGGSRASRVIRQNLAVSLLVILVLVPAAALGVAGIGEAIILHEGSTLAVVGNALRLMGPSV